MRLPMNSCENWSPGLVCVYSLPRSGSTVLIAELDRLNGIVCLPESYFPQLLEFLTPEELSDAKRLAAYYIASSPAGSLLTFDEAKACIVSGNYSKTLIQLGLACAIKTNRDPSQVSVIIWKTTRIISGWKLFSEAGGRFLVLRRNPLNVFESQFRVDFGRHNRNPLRFSFFQESYEAIFSQLPRASTFYVDYEEIPAERASIQEWLGVSSESWRTGESSLTGTHAKHAWHKGLMDGFQSRDSIKRNNVTATHRLLLNAGELLVRPLRPVLGLLRIGYDRKIVEQIRIVANDIYLKSSTHQPTE